MFGRARRGLPAEEIARREREDEATNKLTNAMKQLYQAGRFQSPLRGPGESASPVAASPKLSEIAPELGANFSMN